ncbi:MAG: metallophosphoesterase [Pseudomonadota bacterium]
MLRTNRLPSRLEIIILALTALLVACASIADGQEARSPKIISIGDLHGDYEGYLSILREAGLIDDRDRWAGGDTIFVQTGDVPDRGPDSLKIIEHLQKLQNRARRKGGDVITLVGNHEALNIVGDLRYVHPGEYEAFQTRRSEALRDRVFEANKDNIIAVYRERDPDLSDDDIEAAWKERTPLGRIEHQMEWAPEGEIGSWVVDNPAVVIVNGTLFAHGGLSAKYAEYSIDEINQLTREALLARDVSLESIINDEFGPLWYRGLVPDFSAPADDPDALSPEEELELVLATFGAERLVVGHTPSIAGISSSYDDRFIQIDTGISSYYGGPRSFLRIEDGKVYAHDDGEVTELGTSD